MDDFELVQQIFASMESDYYRSYLFSQDIVDLIGVHLDARRCDIVLLSGHHRTFEYCKSNSSPLPPVRTDSVVDGILRQLEEANPKSIDLNELDKLCQQLTAEKGCLAVPLCWPKSVESEVNDFGKEWIRTLNCFDATGGLGILMIEDWSEERSKASLTVLLRTLARIVSIAVVFDLLQEDNIKVIGYDRFSGLQLNIKMRDLLEAEIERADYYQEEFCLAYCDIDNLSRLMLAHAFGWGDLMIKAVSQVLLTNKRKVDQVGRIGGDEMLVIMPRLTKKEALPLVEELRLKIADVKVQSLEQGLVGTTVSFAVVSYPADGTTYDELVTKAEELCGKAKMAGRNCTVVAE